MENYGGISLEAYAQAENGFNTADANDVAELNKALEATQNRGGAVDGSLTASGAPLKVESLEKTLKVVTFTMKNIVLWKQTPVLPAYNTVEEYNRLVSYGSDQGGFNNEGELPEEDDAVYQRNSQLVKYLGNTRIVTHPMTLVNTAHGAVIEKEINNGTMWILQKLERALVEGNSTITTQEFNGIYKQLMDDFASELAYLNSENVIDVRGMRMDEAAIEEGANTIIENYGYPTDIFWSVRAGSDFAKNFYPRQRTITPVSTGGNKVGANITSFVSQAGEIPFNPSVFMRPKPVKTPASIATSTKAPGAPIPDGAAAVTPVAATVANNRWLTGENGDFIYAVTALNRFGESAPAVLSQVAATIVVNGAADLLFTAAPGQFAPTGFRIYRGLRNVAYGANMDLYPLFDVSTAQLAAGYNGGAALNIRDLNRYLPGTSSAFMLQRDTDVYSFKQLAPLMKMDLALLAPAYRFMVLLYGTPIIYAPRKVVRFINIGSTANATTNALIA